MLRRDLRTLWCRNVVAAVSVFLLVVSAWLGCLLLWVLLLALETRQQQREGEERRRALLAEQRRIEAKAEVVLARSDEVLLRCAGWSEDDYRRTMADIASLPEGRVA